MKIVTDEQTLRQKSRPTSIREVRNLRVIEQLEQALKESETEGVGLSAIQIGIPIRVCIIRMDGEEINLINPVIEEISEPTQFRGEGCLSFPGQRVNTNRYNHCVVRWFDVRGKKQRASFSNLEAVAIQHEIDHMDGILMFDRKLKPFVRKEKKIGRNEPCPCGSGKKYKRCCVDKDNQPGGDI